MKDFSLQSTVPVYEPLEAISIVPCDSKLMNICNKDKLKKAKRSRSDPICFLTAGERGIVRLWIAEG